MLQHSLSWCYTYFFKIDAYHIPPWLNISAWILSHLLNVKHWKYLFLKFSPTVWHSSINEYMWRKQNNYKKQETIIYNYWLNSLNIDICSQQRTWRFVKRYCCSWSHVESYQNAKVLSFPVRRILHWVNQILILRGNDCVAYNNLSANVIFHLFHCMVINYKLPAWNSHLEQQLTIPLVIRPCNLQVHHVHQSSINVSIVSF